MLLCRLGLAPTASLIGRADSVRQPRAARVGAGRRWSQWPGPVPEGQGIPARYHVETRGLEPLTPPCKRESRGVGQRWYLWNPLLHKDFQRLPVLASSGCLRSWCVPNVSPRRSTCSRLRSLAGRAGQPTSMKEARNRRNRDPATEPMPAPAQAHRMAATLAHPLTRVVTTDPGPTRDADRRRTPCCAPPLLGWS